MYWMNCLNYFLSCEQLFFYESSIQCEYIKPTFGVEVRYRRGLNKSQCKAFNVEHLQEVCIFYGSW